MILYISLWFSCDFLEDAPSQESAFPWAAGLDDPWKAADREAADPSDAVITDANKESLSAVLPPVTANRVNKLSDLFDFLGFLMVCYGIFGVSIIPKWLINDPWWIPILFGRFLELPKKTPNLDPCTPYLWLLFYPKILQRILESMWEHL